RSSRSDAPFEKRATEPTDKALPLRRSLAYFVAKVSTPPPGVCHATIPLHHGGQRRHQRRLCTPRSIPLQLLRLAGAARRWLAACGGEGNGGGHGGGGRGGGLLRSRTDPAGEEVPLGEGGEEAGQREEGRQERDRGVSTPDVATHLEIPNQTGVPPHRGLTG